MGERWNRGLRETTEGGMMRRKGVGHCESQVSSPKLIELCLTSPSWPKIHPFHPCPHRSFSLWWSELHKDKLKDFLLGNITEEVLYCTVINVLSSAWNQPPSECDMFLSHRLHIWINLPPQSKGPAWEEPLVYVGTSMLPATLWYLPGSSMLMQSPLSTQSWLCYLHPCSGM